MEVLSANEIWESVP